MSGDKFGKKAAGDGKGFKFTFHKPTNAEEQKTSSGSNLKDNRPPSISISNSNSTQSSSKENTAPTQITSKDSSPAQPSSKENTAPAQNASKDSSPAQPSSKENTAPAQNASKDSSPAQPSSKENTSPAQNASKDSSSAQSPSKDKTVQAKSSADPANKPKYSWQTNKKENEKVEDISEIKNETIKTILERWEVEMNKQVEVFRKRAKLVNRCDRSIYECLDLLLHLDDQIKTLDKSKMNLINSAKQIIKEQNEFLDELDKDGKEDTKAVTEEKKEEPPKKFAFKKPATQAPPPPPTPPPPPKKTNVADKNNQRYKLYEKASNLGYQLHKMSIELKRIKEQNDSFYGNHENKENDIDRIKKIANCHLNAMRYVDKQADELEKRLDYLLYQLQYE